MHKTNVLNDVIVSIKNGYLKNSDYTSCRLTKFSLNLLWILYKEGLISDFKINQKTKKIDVKLKYFNNRPLIQKISLLSRPSLQVYSSYKNTQNLLQYFDYFFISTSSGIVSSRNLSKNLQLGGQLLFALKILN